MALLSTQDATVSSWRRWFRRSNVYIAEYILMLVLVAGFIGVLVSLWFTFLDMVYGGSSTSVTTAATQIGSLLVVGPAAFWLYARVTGQEMVEPLLHERKSRTVFLTIWLFFAVLALVGMVASIVSSFVNAMFGLESDFGATLVTKVLPGLFAVATVVFGLFMVVKHTSRKFVMISALVLAIMAVVLLVANVTMVLVRKDSAPRTPTYPGLTIPGTDSPRMNSGNVNTDDDRDDEDCTYTRYSADECSFSEYMDTLRSDSSSSSSSSRYYR